MLTYNLDKTRSDFLYQQLYNFIKEDIKSAKLGANTKLPSKRTLASHLNISVITVENAYGQLLDEGYIYSKAKSGFFVSSLINPNNKYKKSEDLKKIESLNFFEDVDDDKYFADLSSYQTDPSLFPFATWTKIMKDLSKDKKRSLLSKTPAAGAYELREAISNHLKDFRNMEVNPEQIFVGAGSEYLYNLLVRLLGADKGYAIEDPGYKKLKLIYNSNCANCCLLDTKADNISKQLEEANVDILHISPSHQFPTGTIMPIYSRLSLLSWASKGNNRYIIEDDYDSEFRFNGKAIESLFSMDTSDHVIYINTFSISLSPTIRVSYMILPLDLALRFKKDLSFLSSTVSNFIQYTLADFIKKGYFEKLINKSRTFYKKKRDYFIDCIKKSPLKNIADISEEGLGLHFILKIKSNLSGHDIIKAADQGGLKIKSISDYYDKPKHNSSLSKAFIINYASLSKEQIEASVDLLSKICN